MAMRTSGQPHHRIAVDVQLEILDLIARMNQALDDEDYETYLACYTPDATFDPGLAPLVVGHAAIGQFLRAAQASGFITGKRHLPGAISVRQSGPTVTARFYLTVIERAKAPAVVATAVITDTFERRGETWLTTSHVTRVDPGFLAAQGQVGGAADTRA